MSQPLELKTVNDLLGEDFYIPHYQRGYRWTSQQVNDLLNDIWTFSKKPASEIIQGEFYCLQPVVVKKKTWIENGNEIVGHEVIDGQQRLTTLFIIIQYLAKEFLKVESLMEDYGKELYSIRYETRPHSWSFLQDIVEDNSNIDYYHIYSAYNTIKQWFTNGINIVDRTDKNRFLSTLMGKKEDERSVQVIWYKIEAKQQSYEDEQKNSIELFTRLNIGKIPLTNAELIKALFLSSSSFDQDITEEATRKKLEISHIWDTIEQELGDNHFWSFITNEKQSDFSTKIELLFDLIAGKSRKEIDPLFTFLHFLNKAKDNHELWSLWIKIELYYQTLRQWHKERKYYHKIGYLITVGQELGDLIDLSTSTLKTKFEDELDVRIKNSIRVDYPDLSYENVRERWEIEKILLLFNVESIRQNESISEFYPFNFHKKTPWSIEHIHAQNAELLDKTKKIQWTEWLNYHEKLLLELSNEEKDSEKIDIWNTLLAELGRLNNEKLTWQNFEDFSGKIANTFSESSEEQANGMHAIANLALLSQPDNAALNNSVFEVKRREIIRMDREGKYIPLCTRRVFLKYYNNKPTTQQFFFWSSDDRENYLKEIEKVLVKYLPREPVMED